LFDTGHSQITLDVHDIEPIPKEEFMPPMQSVSYRVMFYYTYFKTAKEFWTSQGNLWSREADRFMAPGDVVTAKVQEITSPSDTQLQKLKKIYAAVQQLENTGFTRLRSTSEERAEGLKSIKTADAVLTHKYGDPNQLTELFVAMARAAGVKAYLMGVTNRSERIFLPQYLDMRQVDEYIALADVDGKETFFDPGMRYCGFGQLSWQHAYTGGLRQTDTGVDIYTTPSSTYKDATIKRIADLTLDEHGVAVGTVQMEYSGDAALEWRDQALRGDETELNTELRTSMEHLLPGGMEIKVTKVQNLTDPDLPLKVSFAVKGAIGSSTGKRLLVPADLFEVNSKPRLPETTRDLPVDMHYPSQTADAVRLTLPPTLVIESAPPPLAGKITGVANFDVKSTSASGSITLYRTVVIGRTVFPKTSYDDLRGFYGKLEAKDQERLVLTHADASVANIGTGGN